METATAPAIKPNLFKELVQTSRHKEEWYSTPKAYVYLLSITHEKGKNKVPVDRFLKIGISTQADISSRIAYLPQCFRVEVLQTIVFERTEAIRIEKLLHASLRQWHYTPRHRFGGKTECYRMSLIDSYSNLQAIIDAVPDIVKAKQEAVNSNPAMSL